MPTPLEQTLANKFRQAQAVFADGWKVGTFDWLKENAVGAVVTINLAEQQMETAWAAARKDPSKIADFDAALDRYKQAYVGALTEFRARSGQ